MLLEELLLACPEPVDEIILVGHSMGGLMIRGTWHYGVERDAPWVRLVSRAFCLGTPHEGAMLEKVAHLMTSVLRAVPHPVVARRSQGVKDLRDGTTVHADNFGDGLVRPPQAGDNVRLFPGLGHLDLAHDEAVYGQIGTLCAST